MPVAHTLGARRPVPCWGATCGMTAAARKERPARTSLSPRHVKACRLEQSGFQTSC
jgi:hypothetical protein